MKTKITLARVSEDKLRDCIRIAYTGDQDMPDIHILQGGTLDEMVDYTWDQSRIDADKAGTKFYAVMLRNEGCIGYTTLVYGDTKMLFTFGINVAYRNKDILKAWLRVIDSYLGYQYFLTLRQKNVRAVNFFLKNGFEMRFDITNQCYILWRRRVTADMKELEMVTDRRLKYRQQFSTH